MIGPNRVINFIPLSTKNRHRGVRLANFGVNSSGAQGGVFLGPQGGDNQFLEVVVMLVGNADSLAETKHAAD